MTVNMLRPASKVSPPDTKTCGAGRGLRKESRDLQELIRQSRRWPCGRCSRTSIRYGRRCPTVHRRPPELRQDAGVRDSHPAGLPAWFTSDLKAPTLFRTLHNYGNTLLLDEAEKLKSNTPDIGEILTMLLAGYKRGGHPIPFNGATVLARLTAWRLDAYARCAV